MVEWLFTVSHLFGVAIGAGGAFMSDAIFFHTIEDKKITPNELRFLKLGSRVVWVGLLVLVVSGALLFSLNTEGYLDSSKFLAKMTIVAVIILNGLYFHFGHIPKIVEETGDSPMLFVSGAVSFVSWVSAIVLGSLRGLPYSYWQIMLVYLVVVCVAIIFALLMRRRIFR